MPALPLDAVGVDADREGLVVTMFLPFSVAERALHPVLAKAETNGEGLDLVICLGYGHFFRLLFLERRLGSYG